MSREDQAAAYLAEASLTLDSARAIFETALISQSPLWAQVGKNGYDAIEQAVSGAIAATGERIPRRHPSKVTLFIDRYDPETEVRERILYWLRRRDESQYVDIRGAVINIPHEQFDRGDAERILEDASAVLRQVERLLDP